MTKAGKSRSFLDHLAVVCLFCQGCTHNADGVLSPRASLKAMEVEPGFKVELVAAEPLVVAPVAMTFDDRGRMWVVEMVGYMPDTLGTGEDQPVGKVVILEDTDGDGEMDRRKVFLDSLVMPRAICLIAGGALVAEPPNLWYYEVVDDKPGHRSVVDTAYAVGGNVEHQPNGLLRALDNWIYSAKHDQRYRRLPDGTWLKEKTHFRGQWGISQDDWGRLYYNDNSNNVYGDFFAPGLGAGNPGQRSVSGYRQTIVGDNRVYPIRANTGVNRGYKEGFLDSLGRLRHFTAACGPLIYRGGLLAGTHAFVPEPAANLIKRNVLHGAGFRTTGVQAHEGKEFLASTDERFRPVGLYDGPDGGIYVLDMYRGIIQHSTYLTPYLKGEIAARNLTLPLGMGRIYRIVPKAAGRHGVVMPSQTDSLVALLGHPNGWVRDQAQRALVDRQATEATEGLRRSLLDGDAPLRTIHALWTLEGLGRLTEADLQALVRHPRWEVRAQAAAAIPSLAVSVPASRLMALLGEIHGHADTLLAPYVMLSLAALAGHEADAYVPAIAQSAMQNAGNPYIVDAAIGGLSGRERGVLDALADADTATVLYRRLSAVLDENRKQAANRDEASLAVRYPTGIALFKTACAPCHGEDGRGVPPIAPPLAGSEWVTGHKDRLLALVLYGMTGPVDVAGRTYKQPDVSGEMPGIAHNDAIDDADLAALLGYIRNAWGNATGDDVVPEELGGVRARFGDRAEPFTQDELYALFGKD